MPARYCSRRLRSRLICASLSHALQVGGVPGVGREQIDRGVDPDLAQRLRHRRVLRAASLRLHLVDVDLSSASTCPSSTRS